MSGFQPSIRVRHFTQGVALGWDMAAPLALSEGRGGNCRSKARAEADSLREWKTRKARTKARWWLKGSGSVQGADGMAGPSTAGFALRSG